MISAQLVSISRARPRHERANVRVSFEGSPPHRETAHTRGMRWVVLVLALLVLVAQPARAEAPEPSLQVLNEAPLVLQGTGFVPLERVRAAVLTSEGVFFRCPRASRLGRFSPFQDWPSARATGRGERSRSEPGEAGRRSCSSRQRSAAAPIPAPCSPTRHVDEARSRMGWGCQVELIDRIYASRTSTLDDADGLSHCPSVQEARIARASTTGDSGAIASR